MISAEFHKILIKSGTIESHTFEKVVVEIRAQNITYVICTTGRFQTQQLVVSIKKEA